MAKTLLLDRTAWDLVADAVGNIAVASEPYSRAQDAASACRLFSGECYYDTTRGIPYWSEILGFAPPANYIRQKLVDAAMTVPGVVTAAAFLASITHRRVTGQVQVTDKSGVTLGANF